MVAPFRAEEMENVSASGKTVNLKHDGTNAELDISEGGFRINLPPLAGSNLEVIRVEGITPAEYAANVLNDNDLINKKYFDDNSSSGGTGIVTVGDGANSSGDYNGNTEVAITNAIASLGDLGGTVFIKGGSYTISNSIALKSNVTVELDSFAKLLAPSLAVNRGIFEITGKGAVVSVTVDNAAKTLVKAGWTSGVNVGDLVVVDLAAAGENIVEVVSVDSADQVTYKGEANNGSKNVSVYRNSPTIKGGFLSLLGNASTCQIVRATRALNVKVQDCVIEFGIGTNLVQSFYRGDFTTYHIKNIKERTLKTELALPNVNIVSFIELANVFDFPSVSITTRKKGQLFSSSIEDIDLGYNTNYNLFISFSTATLYNTRIKNILIPRLATGFFGAGIALKMYSSSIEDIYILNCAGPINLADAIFVDSFFGKFYINLVTTINYWVYITFNTACENSDIGPFHIMNNNNQATKYAPVHCILYLAQQAPATAYTRNKINFLGLTATVERTASISSVNNPVYITAGTNAADKGLFKTIKDIDIKFTLGGVATLTAECRALFDNLVNTTLENISIEMVHTSSGAMPNDKNLNTYFDNLTNVKMTNCTFKGHYWTADPAKVDRGLHISASCKGVGNSCVANALQDEGSNFLLPATTNVLDVTIP